MGLFDKMKEPVFLKETSNAQIQLEQLKSLEPLLTEEGKALIRQDIRHLEYGIEGEKNIAFELKNSHMPMYILHDIYLEDGELNAQIDYLVFTKKICFVIECKNLYGNIEINSDGSFVRNLEYGAVKKKEGIYSPITQNQRHLELIKKVKVDSKNNLLGRLFANKFFDNSYKAIVVLANPKTILNARYAKKEIKEKVIRADQLVQYIKEVYNSSKEQADSEEGMLAWAQSFLALHKDVQKNYTEKYKKYMPKEVEKEKEPSVPKAEPAPAMVDNVSVEDSELFKALKAYRWKKSKEENVKPYFIYNDNQLKDLILKMPGSNEELKEVSGFGDVKVSKYGEDILNIMKEYQTPNT